jgi:prepilin-type N-terminal cleavage/methylation domain-containing protein
MTRSSNKLLKAQTARASRTRRVPRGFSMIELMVSLTIVSLAMATAVVSLRGSVNTSQTRGLATMVTTELKLARQNALTNHAPVAVAFPSGNALPYSQSLYVASGSSQAHVSRVVDYSHDFPQAVLFQGIWPLGDGSPTLNPPTFGARPAPFSPSSWLSPTMQTDFCLIFTPDGNVISNGLPEFNGAYHILTSAGVLYSTGTAPGTAPVPAPPYFAASGAAQPWTITISLQGEISLASGVADSQPGAITLSSDGLPITTPPATPPTVAVLPASEPVEQNLASYPPASPAVPAGINTTVTTDGRVTLQVYATDASTRDLYVQWNATGGNFSFPGPEHMTWDATHTRWTSQWEWSPPFGAVAGQTFGLNCSLGDGLTAAIVPQSSQTLKSSVVLPIYFIDLNGPTATPLELWRINSDGSSQTLMGIYPLNVGGPSGWGTIGLSPDMSKIVLSGNGAATVMSTQNAAVLSQILPSSPGAVNIDYASVAQSGTKMVYAEVSGTEQLYTVIVSDLNGGNSFSIPRVGSDIYGLISEPYSWSPDQSKVLLHPMQGESHADVLNIASQSTTSLNTGAVSPTLMHWSADNWIYFVEAGSNTLVKVLPDGTNMSAPIPLPGGMSSIQSFSISPSGAQLAIMDGSGQLWCMNNDGSSPALLTSVVFSGWGTQLTWGN